MFNYRNISKKSNYLKKNKDVRITLDAKHNEQITKLRVRQKNIPLLLLKLKRNIQKLDMVDNINKRKELEIKISKIKKKIIKLKNKKNIVNYYLKTGNFLYNYYNNIKISNNYKKSKNNFLDKKNNIIVKNKVNDEKSFNSVVDFFNNKQTNQTKQNSYVSTKISTFIETNNDFKRTNYLNEYLIMIENFVLI